MANEYDRTRQLIDGAGHRIDVICERSQRILHGDDVDTLNCNSAITSRQPVASIQAP